MIGLSDSRTTIVAIASATSPSLRGIVRIAGDDAIEILSRFAFLPLLDRSRPGHVAIQMQLGLPLGLVDASAFLWPTSKAYAGCPSVEIHTLGSIPILESVVRAAIEAGARPAGPGEFTMRAFLAGRLDLTQAEAVLGVIDATNRNQLDAALTQLAGNVSAPLRQTRDELLNLLADVEAGLDFVEEDISFIDDATLLRGLKSAFDGVKSIASKMKTRRRSESFHWVVLRGLPNAGKSSLLNAIANQNVAIVSDQAGTTRDVVWKEVVIDGYPLRVADTAGIELSDDEVMRQSQVAAREIQDAASIVVRCVEAAKIDSLDGIADDSVATVIRVATKSDRIDESTKVKLQHEGWLLTSAITGEGITELGKVFAETLSTLPDAGDTGVPGTAARCQDSVARASESLNRAITLVHLNAGQELIASEIRQTLSAIGEITGEIYTDDILDRVFSRFCIGK